MNDKNNNRHDDEKFEDEIRLTAAEQKALANLPKDRAPSPALENRIVGQLKKQGLIKPGHGTIIELTSWRIAAIAAACIVLLAIGYAFGHLAGSQKPESDRPILQPQDNFAAAASLQQAGSDYLKALDRLTIQPAGADNPQTAQSKEVALSTLCTAADQISRFVPRDILAKQLQSVIANETSNQANDDANGVTIESNRVIQF